MNPRAVLAISFILAFILAAVPLGFATSDCPASQPYFGPYNKVEILPNGYKLINEPFTVKATHVDDGVETPLSLKAVEIYFLEGGTKKVLVNQGKTDRSGEYKYTPTQLGKYMVSCGGRSPTFDVKKLLQPTDLGAVCGDGKCESGKLETKTNCPIDCTECGDAVCEGLEDKQNCPEDCIICGDGECDPEEYSPTSCACPEDCIVCGDGICDTAHSENAESCPSDCESFKKEKNVIESFDIGRLVKDYWWILAAIVIGCSAYYVIRKKRASKGKGDYDDAAKEKPIMGKKEKLRDENKHKSDVLEEDREIMEIINELIESGISDKSLEKKLEEFGVSENEAADLIKKARRK